MSKVLCLIGLHKWGPAYWRIVSYDAETWSQDCLRCGIQRNHWKYIKYAKRK